MAAGFDKNGQCIDACFNFGFGLVEIGSVTPKPQTGNPKPRMFRLAQDQAAINRYGLNGDGFHIVEDRLRNRIRDWFIKNSSDYSITRGASETLDEYDFNRSLSAKRLLGVNISKNKTSAPESNDDYILGVKELGPLADYVTINVSCPNQAGITSLQRKGVLEDIMKQVIVARNEYCPQKPPVLVKIGPDMSREELRDVADAVLATGVDGVIISNTTNQRPSSLQSGMLSACLFNLLDEYNTEQWGGLSGPPLKPLALETLSHFYRLTHGSVPLIGCGGISSAEDAIEFARAGASLVQLYTSMSFRGPVVVSEIKRGILQELDKIGEDCTWSDLVGSGQPPKLRTK